MAIVYVNQQNNLGINQSNIEKYEYNLAGSTHFVRYNIQ